MFIYDCDVDEVKREASKYLKGFGVKLRLKKIELKNVVKKETGLFKVRLEKLRLKKVKIQQYDQPVGIPTFVVEACNYLRDKITTDGLFRKPGVAIRQRELKQMLVNGGRLLAECEYNAVDVADLLKLFFRELPEPCIPYVFHDALQRCLEAAERQRDVIQLTLLLLPTEYLCTLAYLMQFLQEVAAHCNSNRMDVNNLAIVWTPNLMPFKTGQVDDKLKKRVTIIQMLIENWSSIGVVPECLYEHLSCWQPSSSLTSHDDLEISHHRKKKNRRSGSLTRMLSGIKRIVKKSGSEDKVSANSTPENSVEVPHTPCIKSTSKKRKNSESDMISSLKKKRREVLESLPHGELLPSVCPTHLTPRILVTQPLRNNPVDDNEPKRKSRFYTSKTSERDEVHKSLRSLSGTRLRMAHFGLGKKNKKKTVIIEDSENSGHELTATPNSLDLTTSSDDYVRVSRSEYEDIKNRVSRIESRISSEFENIVGVSMSDLEMTPDRSAIDNLHTVQSAYEKTLESAEKFNSPTSDELVRRFSRELKIRGSSEKKVIRSPSARKIGSLRRRSKENTPQIKRNLSLNVPSNLAPRHHFYPLHNIRRGKPNTPSNGLPVPPVLLPMDNSEEHLKNSTSQFKTALLDSQRESLGMTLDTSDFDFTSFGVLTRSQARRASSFHGCDLGKVPNSVLSSFKPTTRSSMDSTTWKNAEDFLKEEKSEEKSTTGRPSIAMLRSKNAGMVMAKAKLFNTMVESDCSATSKASASTKPVNTKPQEIKKRNSSKSSKDRKVQKKDSKNSGRKIKRENSAPKQHNEPDIVKLVKPDPHLMSKRDKTSSLCSEKENQTQSIQNYCQRTPLWVRKTMQSQSGDNINSVSTPVKNSDRMVTPLKERNNYKSPRSGLPRHQSKFSTPGRSPRVASHMLTGNRVTPTNNISYAPRRSPRLLLLKPRLNNLNCN